MYFAVFVLALANMQKICISKVINWFPRVQIVHKKVMQKQSIQSIYSRWSYTFCFDHMLHDIPR